MTLVECSNTTGQYHRAIPQGMTWSYLAELRHGGESGGGGAGRSGQVGGVKKVIIIIVTVVIIITVTKVIIITMIIYHDHSITVNARCDN